MTSADFDPAGMLAALHEAGVQFVLVGGMAVILHGDVGVTVDLDVVPDRAARNLERLAAALRTHPSCRRTGGVAVRLLCLNLATRAGDLDLMFRPSGTQGSDFLTWCADGLPR